MVFLGGLSHFSLGFIDLGAQYVDRFFLVLVALKHFLGLIQVVASNLLRGAQVSIRDRGWNLVLGLLSLVHNDLLDATEERFFIQGFGIGLVALKKLVNELVGRFVVAGSVEGASALFAVPSSVWLLLGCFHVLVLVPDLDVNGSASLLCGLALWRILKKE